MSFSSSEEEVSMPNERGDSRCNFPNTENKRHCKFFTKDGDTSRKMRKVNLEESEVKN